MTEIVESIGTNKKHQQVSITKIRASTNALGEVSCALQCQGTHGRHRQATSLGIVGFLIFLLNLMILKQFLREGKGTSWICLTVAILLISQISSSLDFKEQ